MNASRDAVLATLKADVTWIKQAVPATAGLFMLLLTAFFGITMNGLSNRIDDALSKDAIQKVREKAQEEADKAIKAAEGAAKARKSAEEQLDAVENRSVLFIDEGVWESRKETPGFAKVGGGSGYRTFHSDFIAFSDKAEFTQPPIVVLEVQYLDISGPYRFFRGLAEVKAEDKKKGFKFFIQT